MDIRRYWYLIFISTNLELLQSYPCKWKLYKFFPKLTICDEYPSSTTKHFTASQWRAYRANGQIGLCHTSPDTCDLHEVR